MACTIGLGFAIARRLAQEGAHVIVAAVRARDERSKEPVVGGAADALASPKMRSTTSSASLSYACGTHVAGGVMSQHSRAK